MQVTYFLPKFTFFTEGIKGRTSHAHGFLSGLRDNDLDAWLVSGPGYKDLYDATRVNNIILQPRLLRHINVLWVAYTAMRTILDSRWNSDKSMLVVGFYPAIADTSEKADNGHGGVSCQQEEYSAEFKREAVALANQPGVTKAQIGRELDVNPNMITRWRRELAANGSKAFLGQGVARDEEMATLKREVNRLKKERDFLREAATFFASDRK